MNKMRIAALLATATLVATGVTAAILSRKEARAAARRLLAKAEPMAERTREAGEHAVKTAAEQFQAIAPHVAELLETVREQAPHAVEVLSGALPRPALSHKKELAEVTA